MKATFLIITAMFMNFTVSGVLSATDFKPISLRIAAGDSAWSAGNPGKAADVYRQVLTELPADAEVFRPSVIFRLAEAEAAAGRKQTALETLDQLKKFEYVPEHIAMGADELKKTLRTGKIYVPERTAVPDLPEADKTFYVKPGELSDRTQSIKKFAKFAEACSAAAEFLQSNTGKSAEIILAPGEYTVSEPGVISSLAGKLIIRSADAANPAVLTGGVVLKKWTKLDDTELASRLPNGIAQKVLVCSLNDNGIPPLGQLVFGGFSSIRAQGGSHRFKTMPVPELFYKGKQQLMAEWPNKSFTVLPVGRKPSKDKERYKKWDSEDNLWLYGYWNNSWADAYEKVKSVNSDGVISLEPPVNRYGFKRNTGRAVNALCELDVPGEWYLNAAGNLIVFYPPDNFNPDECVLSVYNTPFTAENCSGIELRNISLTNIRGDALVFRNCSDTLL